MYRLKTKNKGFTVIELLLALVIGAIFAAIIFQFFISHNQALNDTEKKSQLQMDMQQVTKYFTESAMETSEISSINGSVVLLNSGNQVSLTNIILKADDCLEYEFTINTPNISYIKRHRNIATESWTQDISKNLSDNAASISITPLGQATFNNCFGISINIQLSIHGLKKTYITNSNVYFRNKKIKIIEEG